MELVEKERIYEMANIRTYKTNLPMVIWIFPKTGNEKHFARIKVSKIYGDKATNDLFPITISDSPCLPDKNIKTGEITKQDLDKVFKFIKLNKDVLMQVWNDEITPDEAIPLFIKI